MAEQTRAERRLKLFLRFVAAAELSAVAGVLMPYSWMQVAHGWLGFAGELPEMEVLQYLTRNTSALYMLNGMLLLAISSNVRRHEVVIYWLARAQWTVGGMIFLIDVYAGLPIYWILGEGPVIMLFGVIANLLLKRMQQETSAAQRPHAKAVSESASA